MHYKTTRYASFGLLILIGVSTVVTQCYLDGEKLTAVMAGIMCVGGFCMIMSSVYQEKYGTWNDDTDNKTSDEPGEDTHVAAPADSTQYSRLKFHPTWRVDLTRLANSLPFVDKPWATVIYYETLYVRDSEVVDSQFNSRPLQFQRHVAMSTLSGAVAFTSNLLNSTGTDKIAGIWIFERDAKKKTTTQVLAFEPGLHTTHVTLPRTVSKSLTAK